MTEEPRLRTKLKGKWHDLFVDKKSGRCIWSEKEAEAIKEKLKEHNADAVLFSITHTKHAVYFRHKYLMFNSLDELMNPEMDR
jgi:hypothetical protein